jgi:hypothetical protein
MLKEGFYQSGIAYAATCFKKTTAGLLKRNSKAYKQ